MAKKLSKKTIERAGKAVHAAPAKNVRPAAKVASKAAAPKVKSPLTKADLEEFRKMLMEKRRALLGDMSGIEAEAFRTNRQERSGDLSNIPIHPADIGSDNYEQEFTLGLLESERTLLTEINDALDRMDEGTYGICLGTGNPIDKARLKARPWAKYCIEYARLIEKGLVRPNEENEDEDEDSAEEEAPAAEEEESVEEEPEE